MGHTHHWYRAETLDPDKFKLWRDDVVLMISKLPPIAPHYPDVPLTIHSYEGIGEPTLTDSVVAFNGNTELIVRGRDMAHEGFYLSQEYDHPWIDGRRYRNDSGWPYTFCKTARKPYDLLVVASLTRLAHHFPDACEIWSDGSDLRDWRAGLAFVRSVFGVAVVPARVARQSVMIE